MKLTILSPLFPPDTGAPAPYVKLLAQKLSHHNLTVIAHGNLPENVPDTSIVAIPKHTFKIILIVRTLLAMQRTKADLLVVNNGPATEVPALLFSFFCSTPIVLIESDPIALTYSERGWRAHIHQALKKRVREVISLPSDSDTYLPPEILPFSERDHALLEAQKMWWQMHCELIESYGT